MQPHPLLVAFDHEVRGSRPKILANTVLILRGVLSGVDAKRFVLLQRDVQIHGLYAIRSQSDQPFPHLSIPPEHCLGELLGSLSIDAALLDEDVGQLVDEIVGEPGSRSWSSGHTREIGMECLE